MHIITVTHIDTACILLEIGGYRILTDPTLDRAGKLYHHGYGAVSVKTDDPALNGVDLSSIDLVLLSHHQHKDNFDHAGRAFTLTVPKVVTTKNSAKHLPNAVGLEPWESFAVETEKLPGLRITAVPAQHHPWWLPEFFSGKTTGFVIEYDGQENGVIYISGDTVFFDGIRQIASRYTIDIGIFHVGSAQFRYLSGFGEYTMNSSGLLKSADILKPKTIVPIHHRGWTHFKESVAHMRSVLSSRNSVVGQFIFLDPGIRTVIVPQ
ncbi:MAG: MBL fold metallo-hydrolase [Bacteroidota bacterium]